MELNILFLRMYLCSLIFSFAYIVLYTYKMMLLLDGNTYENAIQPKQTITNRSIPKLPLTENIPDLPTLYEYYTRDGITTGLSANQPYFTLNNKNITLYSGSMHYFRVHPQYWRDRLRKMRAAGLNAVDTYVPWNLHEPEPGHYDFGQGGTDFQEFLNIKKFLEIVQQEDLLAIVRPGPYICSEWEFGGMPSWLLRGKGMRLRTSDKNFIGYVKKYFTMLFTILAAFQFTKGGPIIAFQVENEYGQLLHNDYKYLKILQKILVDNGVVELLFTSDPPYKSRDKGMILGVLYTANLNNNVKRELETVKLYQTGKPSMVMEYWSGWFDHWTEKHFTQKTEYFHNVLLDILAVPASVNFYMFHGGTNWGFMNGANIKGFSKDNVGFQPVTTSYDYDAPLTEAGDYTKKYKIVKSVLKNYNKIPTRMPPLPQESPRMVYDTVRITSKLTLEEIITNAEHHIQSYSLISMENLPINQNSGQSYGYIVYRKRNLNILQNSVLTIKGHVCDTALVLINGKLISKILETNDDLDEFGYWKAKDASLHLGQRSYKSATLDIVVENYGRVNFGQLYQYHQLKGLWQGQVLINRIALYDWEIIPLEFKSNWTINLRGWHQPNFEVGPALYKGILNVKQKYDTYIDMRGWNEGIVIINGFVLSRYIKLGPQRASYLPAPFLKEDHNEIVIFEHFKPDDVIKFSDDQIF